ncbi:hypothetical protein G9A89_015400 [Geosiphon pyriformis]|nr:hypothetical protein G9A89_015400 [Geosiphon pyriformis]
MKGSIETIHTYKAEQFRSKLLVEKNSLKSSLGSTNGLLPLIQSLPVDQVLKNQILPPNNSITAVEDLGDSEGDNAFFVADLGEIRRQHLRWKKLLPRVKPYYAVKCNPDLLVLRLLAELGTGFDCASKAEIQTVLDLNVDPSKIIYANPCKQASFIRYAAEKNVKLMTFDNAEELHKIKRYFSHAQLVLRILPDDSKSRCKLGLKFGASLDSTGRLLRIAQDLGLNVIGVSFHVGSGCFDENAFADAVFMAKTVFDEASKLGFDFELLDVGGGFTHERLGNGITFEKIAAVLGPAIDEHFPPHIRVIAEPGRYYVASAFTIATHIISRRTVHSDLHETRSMDIVPTVNMEKPSYMYYINDGVYGAFNCILFDHQTVYPKVLLKGENFRFGLDLEEPEYACSIWGPTCDSIDCITKIGTLPELFPGDWLYFEEMGAYTICAASQFNGFHKSKVIYTTTDPFVIDILPEYSLRI